MVSPNYFSDLQALEAARPEVNPFAVPARPDDWKASFAPQNEHPLMQPRERHVASVADKIMTWSALQQRMAAFREQYLPTSSHRF